MQSFKYSWLSFVLITLLLAGSVSTAIAKEPVSAKRPPNFVILLCDNLGYGDIGCFGSKLHRTPHIDQMAKQGMRLTSFYVSSGVCTPSRASLMTGCYPRRVNMHVSEKGGAVLQPISSKGLHPDEITIAEVLKTKGYATACFGKWHLGDQRKFLPTRQGFDIYYGIPYSDNMEPRPGHENWPKLPLVEGEEVVEAPADRDTLCQRYTQRAIQFMAENKDKPFFLYFPHAMPGSTPHPFSSKAFRGKSKNGDYGDSVEEIDWSTGEILKALKELALDDNTLVIWTSDNGTPRSSPADGSNKPLGGSGYTTMEGGQRVPCIVRWPSVVPAGTVNDEVMTTMDLLPTFAKLAGAKLDPERTIDGHDITPLLEDQPGAKSPTEAFFYYQKWQLQAVRSGKWKLHLELPNKLIGLGNKRQPAKAELYDLDADIGETKNVAAQHPEVVAQLTKYAEAARAELGDDDQTGSGQRPAAFVEQPVPLVPSNEK